MAPLGVAAAPVARTSDFNYVVVVQQNGNIEYCRTSTLSAKCADSFVALTCGAQPCVIQPGLPAVVSSTTIAFFDGNGLEIVRPLGDQPTNVLPESHAVAIAIAEHYVAWAREDGTLATVSIDKAPVEGTTPTPLGRTPMMQRVRAITAIDAGVYATFGNEVVFFPR
jgi:hypothetical protein